MNRFILFLLVALPLRLLAQGFEPHPGFVLVRDYVPDVIEDIRYYGTNNFVGSKVDGYEANAAIVSKQAAKRLKEAADEFRKMGFVIRFLMPTVHSVQLTTLSVGQRPLIKRTSRNIIPQ